jgi:hypothetical protein
MTPEGAPDRNMLPGILGDVARLAGVQAAFALAQEYGGQQRYFPRRVRRGDAMAKLVGLKTAQLLCERLGGRRHHVPAARAALRWYAAHALRQNDGLSYAAIAKRLSLTKCYVMHLLEDDKATPAATAPSLRRAAAGAPRCPFCGHRHRDVGTGSSDPRQLVLPI